MASASSPIEVSLSVDVLEASSNAVLWYQTATVGQGREQGRRITKERSVYAQTVPDLTEALTPWLFYDDPSLTSHLQQHFDPHVSRAVLYTPAGFQRRNEVKQAKEAKVERRACATCLLTCGCAICFFGLCPFLDRDSKKPPESSYAPELQADQDASSQNRPGLVFSAAVTPAIAVEVKN
jgi:hypothetical protein